MGIYPQKLLVVTCPFGEMQNLNLEASNTFLPERKRCSTPVKLRRFWCDEIPFLAYQFPNGQIAMNQTQSLPTISKSLSNIAEDFIASNHLLTVNATLPNQAIVVLYPLPTVMALWSHLLSINKLPNRQELLKALLAGIPVLEDSELLPITSSDLKVKVDQAPATLARSIKLQAEDFLLSVWLYQDIFYISDIEGLLLINVPAIWLTELNPAQKKARTLKRNGFSFKEETIFYQEIDIFQVKARVWLDWIIIWGYFAGKGNTKALSLLRYLAIQGLGNRIENLLLDAV